MKNMTWRHVIERPVAVLAAIGDRHIPRLLVITMGAAAFLVGVFFLLLPPSALVRSWSFLLVGAPITFWGVLFVACGAGLATAGFIDHTQSWFLCLVAALSFFSLAFASLSTIEWWGTKAICFVCIVLGWICVLGLLASVAPAAKDALDQ